MDIENLSATISDIYEQDIQLVIDNINQEPIGFWRRSLIRIVISLFESETFLLKNSILTYCEKNNITLKPEILLTLQGKKFTLSDDGKLKQGFMAIKLSDDIRFTFLQLKEIRNFTLIKDFDDIGWNNLKKTIKIRNRITHPKSILEQNISANEIKMCMSAHDWFYSNNIHFLQQESEYLLHERSKLEEILQKKDRKNISSGNLLGGHKP